MAKDDKKPDITPENDKKEKKEKKTAPENAAEDPRGPLNPGESYAEGPVWLDNPSEPLKKRLSEKGIDFDSIKLAMKGDMDSDGVRCDHWLLATADELICLAGTHILEPKKGKHIKTVKLNADFGEISCCSYDLKALANFRVEEFISSAQFTAKKVDPNAPKPEKPAEKPAESSGAEPPPPPPMGGRGRHGGGPGGGFGGGGPGGGFGGGGPGRGHGGGAPSPPDEPDAEYVRITLLTNSKKNDCSLFARYLNQFIDKGYIVLNEKDKKEELFCPKCGERYADPRRKICPRCSNRSEIIKRTIPFFLKYKKHMAVILTMLVLSSAMGVLSPYISSGFYYDKVLDKAGEFYGQILLVLGLIIGMRLINICISIVSGVASSSIAAKIVYDIRKLIFSSIGRLSISFFTNRQTGGLMTQVNNDANTIYWFFVDGFPYFIMNIVQVAVLLVIMLIMNPLLTVLSFVTLPFVMMTISRLFGHSGKLHAKRYGASRSMNSVLSDVLSGVRVVKAFSQEKTEIDRFNSRSQRLANADRNLGVFNNVAYPGVNFLIYLSTVLVTGLGGWMVIKGQMTYGTLLTFTAYMHMIYGPIYFFVGMIHQLSDAFNAMRRLLEVMDAVPDVVESENPIRVGEVEGKVTFRNVDFSYEKNRKVIDNVDFEIEPGHVVGIVGRTGAGKSTLANLLIRLYDTEAGEILIDDINVRDMAFEDLRRNVAIVSQETYLFAGTILDNIRYARPDAGYMEVIEAAKAAGAHDFIIKLPDAYFTNIGFGYRDLSGGERQRVSIARAILRDPKILILDEATTAMDTETERTIQAAIERLTKGRTTIMIAHRLSTLRSADKLIVIENGKMPEYGTHVELLKKKGIYFRLYRLQLEALRNIGIEG